MRRVSLETASKWPLTCHEDPILTTKLRATDIRSPLTVRQRLFRRLSEGSQGPVTMINAPAGSGKTALVSSWVEDGLAPGKVAWLSLDAADVRPEVFWPYVVESLTRSGVTLPTVGSTDGPGSADDRLLAQLCESLSAQVEPVVIVLDNVHLLGSGTVTDGVDFLVRHAGPHLRLISIGRGVSALPVHRYRLAGLVSEIGADELAFTTAEARALFAEHGVQIAEHRVRLLVRRTQGWAAGLRLAALALRAGRTEDAEPIVRDFTGERADVAGYFMAEVLDGQPADVREFLLVTSVAEVLTPELAAQLSGRSDSARLLRSLVESDAFVTTTDGLYYRCHPLFRDVLRIRLRQEEAGDEAWLHRTTSNWLVGNGQPELAAYHAGAGGDWPTATSLLIEHLAIGRLLIGADAARFREVFAQLPAEAEGVAPAVIRAALAIADNRQQDGSRHLSAARACDTDRALPARLAIAVLETMNAAARLNVHETVTAAGVVAAIGVELTAGARPAPADLFALVLSGKGGVLLWAGQLTQAEESLVAALRAAEAAGLDELKTRTLGQIALLNAIHGRLRQATRWAGKATRMADRLGLTGDERPAVIDTALAWIHTERCEPDAVRRHVRSVSALDDPLTAAALTAVRGRHDHDAAGPRPIRPANVPEPPWLPRQRSLQSSSVESGTVQPSRVESSPVESSSAATADDAPTLVTRVEAWVRTATVELDNGRTEHATRALDRALKLAAPEGLRRPIVQAAPQLRRLLRADTQLTRRHPWLSGADAGHAPGDNRPAPGPVEPLTKRELEVLHNMSALLSTQEIADTMFVSVNTVKTHIRGVLRKLSVSKRNDAVRRARDIGLL